MLVNFNPSNEIKNAEKFSAVETVNAETVNAETLQVIEPAQPDELTGSTEGRTALKNATLQAHANENKPFQDFKKGDFVTLIQGLGKDNSIKEFLSIFEDNEYKPAFPLCKIDRIEELSDEELNNYNFMNCKPEGFEGGSFSFVYDLYKNRFNPTSEMLETVIRSVCMLRTPSRCLFVDPQGYEYSRYILALPGSLRSMFAPEFEEIQEDNRRKEEEEKRKQEEEERAKLEFIENCKGFLTPISGYDPKTTKKNILAYLKHEFKGVKFTARKIYESYCITWTDGPSEKEVESFCGLFVDHETDFTGDYYDYKPSLFTSTFGGIKYSVDTNRAYSDEVLNKTVQEVKEVYPGFTGGLDSYERVRIEKESKFLNYYQIIRWHDFTLSEVVKGYLSEISFYEEPAETASAADQIKQEDTATASEGTTATASEETTTAASDSTTATANEDTTTAEGLTLIQYSAKAVAIIGNTFPIKEQLKKLGGRFNARLTCGAGWIFSRKKEQELKAALNIA